MTPNPLRRARRADLPVLAALWSELVELHAALDAAFALRAGAGAALEAELARELDDENHALFVSDADGLAVGFCAVQVQHGPSLAREMRRAEITELVVTPGARRCGRGRELALAALAWARERGATRIEVRVAAANVAGQAFWRSLGFGAFVDVLDRHL